MECPQDKHKIELFLTCEQFQPVQEAAQITGCGDDIERYFFLYPKILS
jgi:hypothetical protein